MIVDIKRIIVEDLRNTKKPKGFYASVIPVIDSAFTEFAAFVQEYALPNDDLIKSPHITLMYSKELPSSLKKQYNSTGDTSVDHFEYWEGHDKAGYLVAKLISDPLQSIHRSLIEAGCKHSFEEYSPHITLRDSLGEASNELHKKIFDANNVLKNHADRHRYNIKIAKIIYDDLR